MPATAPGEADAKVDRAIHPATPACHTPLSPHEHMYMTTDQRLAVAVHALQVIAANTPTDNIDAGYLATTTRKPLKAPFPYPGGKTAVAELVWRRLGDVDNYIESFFGSGAMLLKRPARHLRGGPKRETVNDINHHLVNFWRAVQAAPDEVAKWCDSPVYEADLHARHVWLARTPKSAKFSERMRTDPEYYDAKRAGWWVWGMCCWIGSAWCVEERTDRKQMPKLDAHNGVHGGRPQLADAYDLGRGVHATTGMSQQIPQLSGSAGITQLWGTTCAAKRRQLEEWMQSLSDRLRHVRTCYGHWDRISDSDSTLNRLGISGVFLDPPYPTHRSDNGKKSRDGSLYASDKTQDLNALRDEVLAWCIKYSRDKAIRIALCCYEGDGYEPLAELGWECVEWEANGGYGNQTKKGTKGKSENAKRERLWFSPHCVPDTQLNMLDLLPLDRAIHPATPACHTPLSPHEHMYMTTDQRLAVAVHALQIIAANTPTDNIDAGYLATTTLQSIGAEVKLPRANVDFSEGLLDEENCPDCGRLIHGECECDDVDF